MDIMTGLAALKSAVDITKTLKEIDGDIGTAEYKIQIANLLTALAETKISLVEVQQRVLELEEKARKKGEMTKVNGVAYDVDNKGSAIGNPYCPKCLGKDEKHITCRRHADEQDVYFICPVCDYTMNPDPSVKQILNVGVGKTIIVG